MEGKRYPYRRFLFFDMLGEVLCVLIFGGVGYLFGSAWELASQFVSDFTGFSVGLVILAAGVYFWVRMNSPKESLPSRFSLRTQIRIVR